MGAALWSLVPCELARRVAAHYSGSAGRACSCFRNSDRRSLFSPSFSPPAIAELGLEDSEEWSEVGVGRSFGAVGVLLVLSVSQVLRGVESPLRSLECCVDGNSGRSPIVDCADVRLLLTALVQSASVAGPSLFWPNCLERFGGGANMII